MDGLGDAVGPGEVEVLGPKCPGAGALQAEDLRERSGCAFASLQEMPDAVLLGVKTIGAAGTGEVCAANVCTREIRAG